MASRSDEVQKCVNTVVSEAGVTLDTGLLGEDVIILTLEIATNLGETAHVKSMGGKGQYWGRHDEPSLVINLITKARGIDNGQRDAGAFLVEIKL